MATAERQVKDAAYFLLFFCRTRANFKFVHLPRSSGRAYRSTSESSVSFRCISWPAAFAVPELSDLSGAQAVLVGGFAPIDTRVISQLLPRHSVFLRRSPGLSSATAVLPNPSYMDCYSSCKFSVRRHGEPIWLQRHIPEDIALEVRQRSKFGALCAVVRSISTNTSIQNTQTRRLTSRTRFACCARMHDRVTEATFKEQ